jgi:hypothetical protein
MFELRLPSREVSPVMRPRPLEQPASGHHRIACGEPCDVTLGTTHIQALVWNLSVVGAYVVLPAPLPAPGEPIRLSFALPGDGAPVVCDSRVRWVNAPSIFKGCGRVKLSLPPGCGVEFSALSLRDRERIEARVRATVTSAR